MAAPRAQGTAPRPRTPSRTAARPPTGTRTAARPPARRAATTRTAPAPRPRSTPPGRRPAPARRRPAPRSRTPIALRRWWQRLCVLGGSTLTVVTLLAALAQPPTEAGQVPAATDATGRAQATAATLTEATTRYRAALAEAAGFDSQAQQARDAGATALAAVATDRDAVGDYAATVYRRSAAERWPLAQLSLDSPGAVTDVLHAEGLAEQLAASGRRPGGPRATAAVEAARYTDAAEAAEAAAAVARRKATRRAGRGPRPGRDPAPGRQRAVGRAGHQPHLGRAAGPQRRGADRAGRATSRRLAVADDHPAGRRRPARPRGVPARRPGTAARRRRAAARPAWRPPTPAAASSPCSPPRPSPRSARPSPSWASPTWSARAAPTATAAAASPPRPGPQGGVGLSSDLAEQWAAGTPVPAGQLQVGDLVFSTDERTGLDDVGLYLGGTSVLSASADRWQVAVRAVTDLSHRRPGHRARRRAPAPLPVTGTGVPATCSAPLPAPGYDVRTGRRRLGRLVQRPGPRRPAVLASGRAPAALRRRGGLQRDVGGLRRRPSAARCASPTPTGRCDAQVRRPPPQAGARRGPRHVQPRLGRWPSTCAAGSTSSAPPQTAWMQANAGALRLGAPGLGAGRRAEPRAVALGVRQPHLSGRRGQAQPRSATARQGSVALASVVSAASRAATPASAQATGRWGVTTTCGSRRRSPAAATLGEHRLRAHQHGGGQLRDASEVQSPTGPWPSAAPRRRRPARASAADRVRCTAGRVTRCARAPGHDQLPPADDDPPAQRRLPGVGPVEDGDPGGRRARRAPGGGRPRRPEPRSAVRVAATRARVISTASSPSSTRVRRSASSSTSIGPRTPSSTASCSSRAAHTAGDQPVGRRADVGHPHLRRGSQSLEQPGRGAEEALVTRSTSGQSRPGDGARPGRESTLASSTADSRTGTMSSPQPVARRTRAAGAGQTTSRAAATCSSVSTSARWTAATGCTGLAVERAPDGPLQLLAVGRR